MPLTPAEVAMHDRAIGGSLISAVIGVNPFSGPIDAWLHLTGRAQRDDTEDRVSRQGWGHQMEEMLAAWYEDERSVELATVETVRHPTLDWVIATPDRVGMMGALIVECKHVGERVAWHWYDGAPDYVRAQCVWQMFVMRANGLPCVRVDVVADVGGAPPEIYPIDYDAEIEAMILERATEFWHQHVLADVAPPVDGSASYQAWLRRQFPTGNGVLRSDEAGEMFARQYVEAKNLIAEATASKELAANQLRALIGEDDGVRGDWGQATNRASAKGTRSLKVKLAGLARTKRRATQEDIR